MNTIGSKISSAASAINPFKGTVNTEETSNKQLTFHGTELKLDLGSTGNFALRKIYNSIVNAPGHAFNAVGLKSFTNYLYPGTTGKENLGPTTAQIEEHTGSSLEATGENQVVDHTKTNNGVRDVLKEDLGPITAPAEEHTGSSLKATRENQVVIHTKPNNEVRDLLKEEEVYLKNFSNPEAAYFTDVDGDS
jgi:hypothetical protein